MREYFLLRVSNFKGFRPCSGRAIFDEAANIKAFAKLLKNLSKRKMIDINYIFDKKTFEAHFEKTFINFNGKIFWSILYF